MRQTDLQEVATRAAHLLAIFDPQKDDLSSVFFDTVNDFRPVADVEDFVLNGTVRVLRGYDIHTDKMAYLIQVKK